MVVARALNGNRLGLGVAAPDGLVVRMPVTVRAPGLEISGRIIWARSGRGGIRFDTPISAQQLSVLRRGVVGSLGKTRATSGRPHLAQVYREL